MTSPKVTAIKFHKQSQLLELAFANGLKTNLSAEFLRVHSPSAEVQGHGQPILVENKQTVKITGLEPVGHYAIRIQFDDGHHSGIYSWSWLHQLASQQETLWQSYQEKVKAKQAQNALQIPVQVQFKK